MLDTSAPERTGFWGRLLRRLAGSSRGYSQLANDGGRNGGGEKRTLAVAPEVQVSVHDDGLALLHIPTGRVFLCNRTGSRIWQGVVKGLSADAITEEISRECGVARDLVERHTAAFVTELERRGLLTRRVGG